MINPFPESFLEYASTTIGLDRDDLINAFNSQAIVSADRAAYGARKLLEEDGLRKPLDASLKLAAVEVAWIIIKLGHDIVLPACPRCGARTPLRSRVREGLFEGQAICVPCFSAMKKSGTCFVCEQEKPLSSTLEGERVCRNCRLKATKKPKTCANCGTETLMGRRENQQFVCLNCATFTPQQCTWCGETGKVAKRIGLSRCCVRCYARVTKIQDPCPKCQKTAIIAYPLNGYVATCAACSGVTPKYACRKCGTEEFRDGRHCARCSIRVRGNKLIDSTEADRSFWWPLFELLSHSPNPQSTVNWMKQKAVLNDLKVLLSEAPPSPQLFRRFSPKRADYLRHLIHYYLGIAHDPHEILDLEVDSLSSSLDGPHRQDFIIYYRWHTKRAFGKSKAFLIRNAQGTSISSLRAAQEFLHFLQNNSIAPTAAEPVHWNAYIRRNPTKRVSLYSYYSWKALHDPSLRQTVNLTFADKKPLSELSPEQHRNVIRELTEREDLTPDIRSAGLILALYGQPLTKIVTLTTANLHIEEEGDVFLRLGTTPIEVPLVLGMLLLSSKANGGYSGNGAVDAKWLFPGKAPGTHLSPQTVTKQLRKHLNISADGLKQSGLRHLVRNAPPAIVADIAGYQIRSMEALSQRYAQKWARYPSLRADNL